MWCNCEYLQFLTRCTDFLYRRKFLIYEKGMYLCIYIHVHSENSRFTDIDTVLDRLLSSRHRIDYFVIAPGVSHLSSICELYCTEEKETEPCIRTDTHKGGIRLIRAKLTKRIKYTCIVIWDIVWFTDVKWAECNIYSDESHVCVQRSLWIQSINIKWLRVRSFLFIIPFIFRSLRSSRTIPSLIIPYVRLYGLQKWN